jgi:hypothetical protein
LRAAPHLAVLPGAFIRAKAKGGEIVGDGIEHLARHLRPLSAQKTGTSVMNANQEEKSP